MSAGVGRDVPFHVQHEVQPPRPFVPADAMVIAVVVVELSVVPGARPDLDPPAEVDAAAEELREGKGAPYTTVTVTVTVTVLDRWDGDGGVHRPHQKQERRVRGELLLAK